MKPLNNGRKVTGSTTNFSLNTGNIPFVKGCRCGKCDGFKYPTSQQLDANDMLVQQVSDIIARVKGQRQLMNRGELT